ncbi:hypothetical protein [Terriglobus sp.]|uniref:hypothetical protein n=1 Tax=Terriglobus sp. TaxID=1889013 RepID=UPI003B00749D
MPMVLSKTDRIVHDRFGRAYAVCYRNPDGSLFGDLLPGSPSRSPHHRRHPGHHDLAIRNARAAVAVPASPRPSPSRFNRYSGERIDPKDGMADNPLAQALFHSQIGQGEWQASYRLVRNTTVVYSSLVFLAVFGPGIPAASSYALRWSLNQAGAFGPAINRLFWSSTGAVGATRYGGQLGGYVGTTLEETPIGQYADWIQMYLKPTPLTGSVWRWLSTAFAEGAEGEAVYFYGRDEFGMLKQGPVWLYTESPILLRRGVPIRYVR